MDQSIQPEESRLTAFDVHADYVPSDSATVVIKLPAAYYNNLKEPAKSALDQRISTKIGNLMGNGSFVSRIFYDKK